MNVPGKRRKCRPKRMCMDRIKDELNEKGLSSGKTQSLASRWRNTGPVLKLKDMLMKKKIGA